MILADTLRNGYDKSVGYLLGTKGGQMVVAALLLVAVYLAIRLIHALVCKGMGRQNQSVQEYASDGKKIGVIILAIILLIGPATWLPWLMSMIDYLITAGGNFLTHYFGTK